MLLNCGVVLRVPWTERRSNQSTLKEISHEYSLEGLMLTQYFGHLMWRADSLEKTLMLGKIDGGRKRGRQRMRWLDSITDSITWAWANSGSWWWTGKPGVGGLHCLNGHESESVSCLVVWNSLRPHGLEYARPPFSSPTPGACSNSCPSSQWCHPTIHPLFPLLLLPSIFPNIRVFSNESALCIRWPKYWCFSFNVSSSRTDLL